MNNRNLHIRALPEGLLWRLKAIAAEQHMTLREFCIRAIVKAADNRGRGIRQSTEPPVQDSESQTADSQDFPGAA